MTIEQKQRLFKARIALALYAKYGRVPKTTDINRIYGRSRAAHAADSAPGLHLRSKVPQQQLVLF